MQLDLTSAFRFTMWLDLTPSLFILYPFEVTAPMWALGKTGALGIKPVINGHGRCNGYVHRTTSGHAPGYTPPRVWGGCVVCSPPQAAPGDLT